MQMDVEIVNFFPLFLSFFLQLLEIVNGAKIAV